MSKKGFFSKLWALDDDVSSKRVVALVGFFLLCVGFVMSLFIEVKIKEFIWDGMLWIVLGGLGLTVVEKFSNVKGKKSNPIDPVVTTEPTETEQPVETSQNSEIQQLNS